MEERLKILLYNAVSVIYDNTGGNGLDDIEWYEELKDMLGITEDELEQFCGVTCNTEDGINW